MNDAELSGNWGGTFSLFKGALLTLKVGRVPVALRVNSSTHDLKNEISGTPQDLCLYSTIFSIAPSFAIALSNSAFMPLDLFPVLRLRLKTPSEQEFDLFMHRFAP